MLSYTGFSAHAFWVMAIDRSERRNNMVLNGFCLLSSDVWKLETRASSRGSTARNNNSRPQINSPIFQSVFVFRLAGILSDISGYTAIPELETTLYTGL